MNSPSVSDKISLCQMLQCVAGLKEEDFELEPYFDIVERLEVPDDLIEQHIHFTEESYARNLIFVTPRFEMIVMCWKPGQISSIHDHLDSFAISKVERGTLCNRNFRRTDDGQKEGYAEIEMINEEFKPAGSWLKLDRDAIHQMGNHPDADEDLVTIHYYARPLREIHYYHPEKKSIERVRLVYSLLHF